MATHPPRAGPRVSRGNAKRPLAGIPQSSRHVRDTRHTFFYQLNQLDGTFLINYSEWTAISRTCNLETMHRPATLAALKKRVGSRIRRRRDEFGMSQEALAFEAEMTASYLSQIEGGKRNPSLQALHRLSCALRLDVEELLKA